jgi:hypothetical protein
LVVSYEGEPVVKLLPDGRNAQLGADLVIIGPQGVRGAVPAGATVNGASIPRAFWPVIGGPFEGRYRDASIIHDWFCDRRIRTWQATHRVFHDAMIVSGVSAPKAKLMYFAVYWAGPRWEERVTLHTTLPVDTSYHFFRKPVDMASILPTIRSVETVSLASPGSQYQEAQQQALYAKVEAKLENMDLDAIERLADSLVDDEAAQN